MSNQQQQQSAEPDGSDEGRKPVRRRGLIAGAATLMAMMIAEGTAAAATPTPKAPGGPVVIDGQNTGSGTTYLYSPGDYVFAALSQNTAGGYPTGLAGVARVPTGVGVKGAGFKHGVQGLIDSGQNQPDQIAVQGASYGTGLHTEGVQGLIVGTTPPNYATPADNSIAIEGTNYSTGNGVTGILGTIANDPTSSASASTAISGINYATTGTTVGIYGQSVNGNGIWGNSTNGPGLVGWSVTNHGIVGKTSATDGAHAALFGYTAQQTAIAVQGTGAVAGSYAAVFNGTTVVKGQFINQTSAPTTAVPHADGTQRLVYGVHSPEPWLEDFGTGTLVNGQTNVAISPDFRDVADMSAYHVFLTEYDDHHDLFVTNRTSTGFEVHAKDASAASGTFSYRIVATRADGESERFTLFQAPEDLAEPDSAAPFTARPRAPVM